MNKLTHAKVSRGYDLRDPGVDTPLSFTTLFPNAFAGKSNGLVVGIHGVRKGDRIALSDVAMPAGTPSGNLTFTLGAMAGPTPPHAAFSWGTDAPVSTHDVTPGENLGRCATADDPYSRRAEVITAGAAPHTANIDALGDGTIWLFVNWTPTPHKR
jgi:hypothetical protein